VGEGKETFQFTSYAKAVIAYRVGRLAELQRSLKAVVPTVSFVRDICRVTVQLPVEGALVWTADDLMDAHHYLELFMDRLAFLYIKVPGLKPPGSIAATAAWQFRYGEGQMADGYVVMAEGRIVLPTVGAA
jgi:hypothetical protein